MQNEYKNLKLTLKYFFYYIIVVLKIILLSFLIKFSVSFFDFEIIETFKEPKGLIYSRLEINNSNFTLTVILLVLISTLLFSIISNLLIIPDFTEDNYIDE